MARRRSLAGVGRLLICCAASALSPAVGAEEPDLEQVVVTGSRIARPDFESASPIVSIDQQAFERAASSTVDTALNRMPQFVAQYTSTSNNPGNWGRANVQLRGLGSESTLVLLNGRRLVPAGTEFAGGRGQVYGYLGYSKRDAVLDADRSYTSVPLEYFASARSRGCRRICCPTSRVRISGSAFTAGTPT